jgi:hypothetical protein
MTLPRRFLLPLWVVLVLSAYYLVLFTNLGNYYRGGTPAGTVLVDAAIVVGAFSSWEVFRSERFLPLRAIALAVGIPLVLVALLTLWLDLNRYVRVASIGLI